MLGPDTPAAGPITLSTGILSKHQDDLASCHVTNVSTTTIANVRIVLFDRVGGIIGESIVNVLPGESRRVDRLEFNFARCQFSFVGFASDVRATLVIQDVATLDPLAALDAR